MRVAVTGATGLLGGALATSLRADGHTVHGITRSPRKAGPDDVVWDPDGGRLDPEPLEGVDAVVHYASEPLADARWTVAAKQRIRRSWEAGTRLVAETLAGLSDPPEVLVSRSAVGFYGSRGDEIITESTPRGDDFLAEVCVVGEEATDPAREAGIRVVLPRIGVVIAEGGPLIDKVKVPFKLGVGGKVGSGEQYVPWIALEDQVRGVRYLMDHDELAGPINLVAPTPVTNRELTRALGDVLRRPTVLPIPLLAIRLLYGEMGAALAAVSQRVVPERLLAAGFEFRYVDLRAALAVALGRAPAA